MSSDSLFTRLWNNISHLGIEDTKEENIIRNRQVILTNQIAISFVILFTSSVLLNFFVIHSKHPNVRALLNSLPLLILLFCLYLNYRKKVTASRIIITMALPLIIFSEIMYYKIFINIITVISLTDFLTPRSLIFMNLLFPLILFNVRHEKKLFFMSIAINLICIVSYDLFHYINNYTIHEASLKDLSPFFLIIQFLHSILLFAAFTFMQKINSEHEQSLKEVNTKINIMNADLEHLIIERTNKLNRIKNELETFLYRSSHDMRSPLTTLKGVSMAGRTLTNESEIMTLFDYADKTIKSMDKMLHKFSSVGVLYQNELEIEKNIDLTKIIDDIKNSFAEEIKEKGIDFQAKISDNISLSGKKQYLKIILFQLIENSILFSNSTNPFVNITVSKTDRSIQIIISDNGMGIDEKYHARIFEMYFRANEHSKGNGLGLFVVQKAIEVAGYSISFTSKPGEGSTFVVECGLVE